MTLKEKVQLKEKGQVANLPTVNQLKVSLQWTKNVDLDLMAFGRKKDGTTFGIVSDLITKDATSMGSLNAFPFMMLDQDAGVGAEGGENEETMKIVNLDEVAMLQIVALNYSDAASNNANASFSDYDGRVVILDDKGNNFEVSLNSTEHGTVAVLATIDNSSAIGATLKNENRVITFDTFLEEIPVAKELICK